MTHIRWCEVAEREDHEGAKLLEGASDVDYEAAGQQRAVRKRTKAYGRAIVGV